MSNISYRLADKASIDAIADNLRIADYEEFVMATGRSPKKGGLSASVCAAADYADAYIGYYRNQPVAVFGCFPGANHAAPWLLGTQLLTHGGLGKELVSQGHRMLAWWAAKYGTLRNYAYAENHAHIAYLRHLGCEVKPAQPYGPLGAPFREFTYVLRTRSN